MKNGIAESLELCVLARALFRSSMLRMQSEGMSDDSPANYCKGLIAKKLGPSGAWDEHLADEITFNSHIYLCGSEQHLQGIEVLLRGGPYGLAVGPLSRSVSEAAARSSWLLDNRLDNSSVGSRRRVARLLLDKAENATRYKNLAYGLDVPERAKAGDEYRSSRDLISKPGLFYASEIVVYDRAGRIALAEQRLPGPSALVREAARIFGSDENQTRSAYGYLSSMAHPTLFAFIETLTEVSEKEFDGVVPLREDDRSVKTLVFNAVGDFRNAWGAWMSWVAAGDTELKVLDGEYERLSADT